jgi:hypothetical protein
MTKSTSLLWSADMREPVPPVKLEGYVYNHRIKCQEGTWMLHKSESLTLIIVGKLEKRAGKVLANYKNAGKAVQEVDCELDVDYEQVKIGTISNT